jgi:hypothetical protein
MSECRIQTNIRNELPVTDDRRLYGLPEAEWMESDPSAVYESAEENFDSRPESFTIEEWSVHPPRYHLPTSDVLIGWIADWVADNGGRIMDGVMGFEVESAEATVAAEALLQVIANNITGMMADKRLRTLTVTWNSDGGPLLDGEPMYLPVGGLTERIEP